MLSMVMRAWSSSDGGKEGMDSRKRLPRRLGVTVMALGPGSGGSGGGSGGSGGGGGGSAGSTGLTTHFMDGYKGVDLWVKKHIKVEV